VTIGYISHTRTLHFKTKSLFNF